ncbi:MAG: hypothetical protein E6767_12325 [Dysgonomonas sp.]|nr:hypothetical protein [Dysgonomonas sp.]
MDAVSLNKALLEALRQKMPEGINVVNVLLTILPLGREAIYRRLREEVPFTFLEVAIIAWKLGISLDQVVGKGLSDNSFFELKYHRHYQLTEKDYDMAYEYIEVLKYAQRDPTAEQAFTSTIFPQLHANFYYYLAKYSSFKWMYLNGSPNTIKTYQEMEFPDKLFEAHRTTALETMNINTCFIWDGMLFLSIVKELKFFKDVNLMTDKDIKELKAELYEFLDYLEKIASSGRSDTGKKIQIYISNVNSDASYSYLETSHLYLSMINAFALNYVVALDKQTLTRVKERVHSLKRLSTLISESGEIQRMQFFKKQRELVSSL